METLMIKNNFTKEYINESTNDLSYVGGFFSIHRKDKILREVYSSLNEYPVEDGYLHPLESFFYNYIQDSGHVAVTCIQDIFMEKLSSDLPMAADILILIGRIESEIMFSPGILMSYVGLTQSSPRLREAGLRLIENWRPRLSMVQSNLESYIQKENKAWLRDYAIEILQSLDN